MQEAEALAAQWEALESKYGSYFQIYENEIQKWAGVDWRPQIIETVFLSNPVSRVEKTSDTLYDGQGIGLVSVETAVHRYHGNLTVETGGNVFRANVLLNL